MKQPITKRLKDGIATLSFNRPEVFNSFNREMALLLQMHLDTCSKNTDVRAIVLTGNGKAFCAGQDLNELIDPSLNLGFGKILDEHFNPIITKIRTIEKPIIAAVNGVAAGAGANIALACDIVIAHDKVSFIQAFSKIGLIPDCAGTYFLPRLIGIGKASAIMMLGDKISATEAEKMGMIYKVTTLENFESEVTAVAEALVKIPAKALGLTKRLLNKYMTNTLEDQLALESKLQVEASATEDFVKCVEAFVGKRKPTFKGV